MSRGLCGPASIASPAAGRSLLDFGYERLVLRHRGMNNLTSPTRPRGVPAVRDAAAFY